MHGLWIIMCDVTHAFPQCLSGVYTETFAFTLISSKKYCAIRISRTHKLSALTKVPIFPVFDVNSSPVCWCTPLSLNRGSAE